MKGEEGMINGCIEPLTDLKDGGERDIQWWERKSEKRKEEGKTCLDPVSYCIGKYFEAEVVGLVQQQAGKGWGSLPGCALRATNALGGGANPEVASASTEL